MDIGWDTIGHFFFPAVAAIFIVHGVLGIISALESLRWPQTSGVILSAMVEDSGNHYRAAVSYRYEVNGQELIGKRVRFGDSVGTSFAFPARRLVRRFVPGSTVTVWYNPKKPMASVLEPGVTTLLILEVAFGCLFFAIAMARLRASTGH